MGVPGADKLRVVSFEDGKSYPLRDALFLVGCFVTLGIFVFNVVSFELNKPVQYKTVSLSNPAEALKYLESNDENIIDPACPCTKSSIKSVELYGLSPDTFDSSPAFVAALAKVNETMTLENEGTAGFSGGEFEKGEVLRTWFAVASDKVARSLVKRTPLISTAFVISDAELRENLNEIYSENADDFLDSLFTATELRKIEVLVSESSPPFESYATVKDDVFGVASRTEVWIAAMSELNFIYQTFIEVPGTFYSYDRYINVCAPVKCTYFEELGSEVGVFTAIGTAGSIFGIMIAVLSLVYKTILKARGHHPSQHPEEDNAKAVDTSDDLESGE